MAGGIFISYRRDDSRHAAGRLFERLEQTFTRHQLFMDVDVIEPGLDFVAVIGQRVESCDVLLALVGPGWLDTRSASGRRRLDNPSDFVRLEIETALRRNIRVIPVLLDGASLPSEGDLPDSLKPLARRQAVRIAHERFATDADGLVQSLARVVEPRRQLAPAEAHRATQSVVPTSRSLFYRLIALVYALLALPAWVAIVVALDSWASPLSPIINFGGFANLVLPAVLIAAIGVSLRRHRGTQGVTFEVALYWIGTILPLLPIILIWFLDAFGPGTKEEGRLAALAALVGFGVLTVAMIRDLRRNKSPR